MMKFKHQTINNHTFLEKPFYKRFENRKLVFEFCRHSTAKFLSLFRSKGYLDLAPVYCNTGHSSNLDIKINRNFQNYTPNTQKDVISTGQVGGGKR